MGQFYPEINSHPLLTHSVGGEKSVSVIDRLPSVISAKEAFPKLFDRPNGRLCVLREVGHTRTILWRDEWRRCTLAKYSFVIPKYLKPDAKAARSEDFLAREWIVIEGDKRLTLEQQIEVHHKLDRFSRLSVRVAMLVR
jgi:hypothetical protein